MPLVLLLPKQYCVKEIKRKMMKLKAQIKARECRERNGSPKSKTGDGNGEERNIPESQVLF